MTDCYLFGTILVYVIKENRSIFEKEYMGIL